MLSIGRKKIEEKKLTGLITLQQGDSENLPFKDGTFDAVMVAFGVRNFQHLQQGLTEMKRMLHTGGKLFILEFSKPTAFPVKQLYAFYSTFILPFLGKFISGDKAAYSYLPQSVQHFPSGNELALILNECGFNNVEIKPFTFGIVTLYIAWP
jgi:demethylmenaquinone methyltransferase/2-methoxy-6-polyprenyl-1,4-benzoquinol methylase